VGEDLPAATAWGDTASTSKMANPDNLKFSEAARTLYIGEDCSQHVTCMGWAYNVDTKALTRVLTAPVAAELTGLGAYDDINGFSYVTMNFQHSGGSNDWLAPLHNKAKPIVKQSLLELFPSAAFVGYLQGINSKTGKPREMQLLVPNPTWVPTAAPSAKPSSPTLSPVTKGKSIH